MSRSSEWRTAMGNSTIRSLVERYIEFSTKSGAVFGQYPEVEPLRFFVFKGLLVERHAHGLKDHVKHWLRPFLRRARTHLPDRRADVLIWVENKYEVVVDALLPVYRELVARDVDLELVSHRGPENLPAAARVFEYPARARSPVWASAAWEALCDCEEGLRDRTLRRSFHHACAMLQGLYEELHRLLDAAAPKVVLCASTQQIGGAALMVASRQQSIRSLLLQHGMLGSNYTPLLADLMLIWGPSSEEIMVSLGLPRARLLTVGSPRHDSMRPSRNGQARVTLLRALGLSDRPTFVFFSQGNDPAAPDAAVESARWLETMAAQYASALNVVVRLHADEDGTLYRGCPHLRVMSRGVELATVLDGCDWIGSLDSTVLYDGLLYGKPAWQLDADHWPTIGLNWRQGLAVRVSSERHFSDMVREIFAQGAASGVDEALVARAFANHGRATQVVADVVTSQLRPPEPDPRASALKQRHVTGV